MLVKAAKGVKVPREDNSRRYIEDEPTEVRDSTYYRRRVMHGDLEEVDSDLPKPINEPAMTEEPTAPTPRETLGEPTTFHKDKE